ncbi:MAG: asparagine synthase (glutamine-hydrolyzing) [Alphaproteobacteria bacterium]|jgi:asparagine synthase (glutamine-hydrolysing)
MCGIAGFLARRNHGRDHLEGLAQRMGDVMAHRGPDGGGVWTDAESGVAFAHRRLSIIDLSKAGHQPMTSGQGRMVISYNGEIYNAAELRAELQESGVKFEGHSDTEVILEGCVRWGVTATIEKLIGMFAIALWDKAEKQLWLVRDRLGIKPLYWTAAPDQTFIFGSELKALRAHPDCPREIDRNAVAAFMRHNYIPGPFSIYKGVNKLQPGHILRVSVDNPTPVIDVYWSMDDVVDQGRQAPFSGSDGDALEALETLFTDAVSRRMTADVPLGAFLSGGIDSSTVVALMQANSTRPVKTFSIGFNEDGFDEAVHAKAVAAHLGADHTELYVTPDEARAVIPKLPDYYDEPFADSSQIPTYLVSAMTRKHVTVALSGDGGDELFTGYNRYFQARNIGRMLNIAPGPLRSAAGSAIRAFPPSFWDCVFKLIPPSRRPPQAGDKMHKLSTVLNTDRDGFYRRIISHWPQPDDIVIGGHETKGVIWDESLKQRIPDFTQRMQYLDTLTYLPDDILTKVDRASMAVSLEARVPILDHRLVEFAWRLPESMKIRNGEGKWLLRQLLYKYVPKSMIDRPKMGFGVPIGDWMRGPLQEWADDLLSESMFKKHGLLEAAPVLEKWRDHKSGRRNWQYLIWDVLMLHAWAEKHHAGGAA